MAVLRVVPSPTAAVRFRDLGPLLVDRGGDARPVGGASMLIHEHGGYRLVVRPDQVDSLRFEQLAQEAGDLLGGGQPERALRRADEALLLWRGHPFSPFGDRAWAAPTASRLREMRGQVRERRVEALLAAGSAREAVRLYAAPRAHHRSVGLRWPRDELTSTLRERATSRLDRRAAEQAGAEGHALTLADLAAGIRSPHARPAHP